ncbi:SsrA-binding protein SmpB [Gracilimonas mengyeensis]|uniref:SsrA-binding protein n=1 Tax=Gracilimonas mengyeensis TaxID=1302730 RepID=A0A521BWC6_9BACT|nr:SsrA-binding protein SmpB [Gracilimonas mengyeensis]SMO50911.1 SsrA-binding protein [Gracilimonas mengyeensis]
MSDKKTTPTIQNRKARHDYYVEETYEAGLALKGTEVKSLRQGKASFTDSFAYLQNGEAWLRELYIKPYEHGSYYNHDPRRPRKLLLHKREIRELDKAIQQKGFTIIPLKLYFKRGNAKVLIGVAKGKKQYDKRDSIKEKDVKRQIERNVKGNYKINM